MLPKVYWEEVMRIGHDSPFAGQIGVRKTLDRIWQHFYWPGIRKDVIQYCRSCHTCQVVGKPNQTVAVAPLKPIPVTVDIVGPLPKTKSGNEYILTLMDTFSRYPEAIPLRRVHAKVVLQELIKFFTRWGLPRELQTDQGSVFLSKEVMQGLGALGIVKVTSSAYHPQSQGALERYHQTLKSMLRKWCLENHKGWDQALPYLLFAVREVPNESLGLSPFDMVLGHCVREPLKVLKECLLEQQCAPGVIKSVEEMRSNHLRAKFSEPYEVMKRVGELKYIVGTPDRRRKQQLCLLIMLKAYQETDKSDELLSQYQEIFRDALGRTNLTLHDVDVGDAKPIKQAPYCVNPQRAAIIKKEIDYMLAHDLIQPAQSEWSSQIILVPKSDGTQRFCIDFRRVNAVTNKDSYPLPRIEECIDKVGGSRFISKLDLLRGYWQVPLTPRAQSISCFTALGRTYQCNVMPFGMTNAPATFQRLMNNLTENIPVINLTKCDFVEAKAHYLRYVIGQGKVAQPHAKVEAILNIATPKTPDLSEPFSLYYDTSNMARAKVQNH
ncbi:uncharacterized protein LOC143025739 [Oratosquilla oratoria]|uniref:uncharacterized protein LOC143025739 n=1 Tax=Oratosquilla oratoria TaxID=337810 RepID=UPI003F7577F5